ncbi:MAG TPA: hypothetical protein VK832_12990, partial [Burkholderiaceae bacterium]|nr:hypothetical protein [Burkholderiaceae bacterium]
MQFERGPQAKISVIPMSANISTIPNPAVDSTSKIDVVPVVDHALLATMRTQRMQDFLFHKVTLLFAL